MFSTLGYWICWPFAWLTRQFYELTGSYGVALILFTLVVKLVLLPFMMKSKRSMIRMNMVSGQLQEIQKRYANNREKMAEEQQRLYQENGINPMSGCLWSFIPMPILIALYYIIRQPITHFMMLSKEVCQSLAEKDHRCLTAPGHTLPCGRDGTAGSAAAPASSPSAPRTSPGPPGRTGSRWGCSGSRAAARGRYSSGRTSQAR